MEIKNTVKNKLSEAKDKAVAFASAAAPYIAIGVASGTIVYITARASHDAGYCQGFLEGNKLGKRAVIETISDLAKNVGTK